MVAFAIDFAETVIADILDEARWKLIDIRDEFTEERYTKIYDEYNDKLFDLIQELEPDYFDRTYIDRLTTRRYTR